MITIKQIESLRRAARKDGIARIEHLCLAAAEELGHLSNTPAGLRAAVESPSIKAITREYPHRKATKLGHTVHRQNDSLECSRCGRFGSVADLEERGLLLKGPIFAQRCG